MVGYLYHTHTSNASTPYRVSYNALELTIANLKLLVDHSADIWSIGCVFLETVIWLVDGWEGLVSFGMSRRNQGQENNETEGAYDSFFDISQSDGDQLIPIIKPSVLQVGSLPLSRMFFLLTFRYSASSSSPRTLESAPISGICYI